MVSFLTTVILTLVVIYSLANILLGLLGWKRTGKGKGEYYIAGGKLGAFVTFWVFVSTYLSTYAFVGHGVTYYFWGCQWALIDTISYAAVITPLTIFLALRLYKLGKMHNYITPTDLIAHRSGEKLDIPLRILVGFGLIFFPSVFYVSMQLQAMGGMLAGLTGGELSYEFLVLLFAAIIAIYTVLGGLRGVAYTDILQGLTFTALIFGLVIVLIVKWGGLAELIQAAVNTPKGQEVFQPAPSLALPPQYMYSYIILANITWTCLAPHILVRTYSARDTKAVLSMGLGSGIFIPITYALVPIVIGAALVATFPQPPDLSAPEELLSLLFIKFFGPVLAAVLMLGLIAAGNTTAAALLVLNASVLHIDIFEKVFKVQWDHRKVDITSRLLVLIVLGIAVSAALKPDIPIVGIAVKYIWSGYAVLSIPIVIMLIWRRATGWGIFAGILTGFIVLLLNLFVLFPDWPYNPWGLWEGAIPTLVSGIVTVVVSLLTPPPSEEFLRKFYGE